MTTERATTNASLVSVLWNICGQTAAAAETVVALQAQGYSNFELLMVDDHQPTDEAQLNLRELVVKDPRIRVLPRMAASSGESLLYLLRQSRGDYVAICSSGGHFLPDAFQVAVDTFDINPHAGIVCGDNFLIDARGKSRLEVDVVTLLFTQYRPFLPAGLFRRQALVDVGLHEENWLLESIELDLCLRLACDFGILGVPRKFFACEDPAVQHDGFHRNAIRALEDRIQLVTTVFSVTGFWGANKAFLLECMANQLGNLREQFLRHGSSEMEPLAIAQLKSTARQLDLLLRNDHRVLRNLHRLFCARGDALGILSEPLQKLLALASRQTGRMAIHIPYQLWNFTFGVGSRVKRRMLMTACSDHHPAAPPREEMFADLYGLAATRHDARGQVDIALEMWKLAQPLGSADVDGLACQALLKLPEATDEMIAEFQADWVERHVGRQESLTVTTPNYPVITRKIRVGYHCSFMYSDTIRYMMRDVLRAHDRTRFEIYAYSPDPVPADIAAAFDVVRNTGVVGRFDPQPIGGSPAISDDAFVSLVRSDQIDVLVECTGFSLGNRFAAMSRRCAPVQVSYLNHTGSSHVPNVDYVIADDIGAPESDQPLYSERIQRLPGSFFCFDYRDSESPPIVAPPVLTRGFPTFGCFGYGGKFNRQLIALWARLLDQVPNAVLHLQNSQLTNYDCRHFISTQFRTLGIGHDRLILAGGVGRNDLLQVYNHIDISLDTWPYCGGNTLAESLWMGVPVVTLKGTRFSARYGASLLAAAGCQDLVAETPEDYVEIVARLANDTPRLQSLRRNLRQMSIDHGLGDSKRFARNLEAAYVEMLGRNGAQPAGIETARPARSPALTAAAPR